MKEYLNICTWMRGREVGGREGRVGGREREGRFEEGREGWSEAG